MKFFIARRIHELNMGCTVEEEIERITKPEDFKYEIKNALGQWEEVTADYFSGVAAKEQVS